jgi:hypothetical protein
MSSKMVELLFYKIKMSVRIWKNKKKWFLSTFLEVLEYLTDDVNVISLFWTTDEILPDIKAQDIYERIMA